MPSKSDLTKQRIVQAANQLFYRKGFSQTSFSDVVAEADVPRGNIYYYFKSKEEILKAVIRYRLDTIAGMLAEWDKSIKEPQKRLERFVRIMYDSTPALLRSGCPMGTLAMEFAKGGQELKEQSKMLFDIFQRWLVNQFSDMGYTEEAHDLSLQLLARGQGLIVVSQVYQDPGFLERGTRELDRWIDELARYA
ncbi:MAG: TetR/AcrR family transcriptional regulator [Gammaproteobacteria bacterium]|nr:TetR/AcrR family transcriptional regulator [Gammaproteobacteria bacterium]MCP5407206.1 TetR/AcrR family transcriptional regulator [Chromatiaceae bacterium]MCP5408236.1 TetR/AcrR family transcriptional regulator [Chromatiaceae bacterium]MCP5442050.1 TetR/AcrR family transcriptional regulator [Chromatiaceae bacterium]